MSTDFMPLANILLNRYGKLGYGGFKSKYDSNKQMLLKIHSVFLKHAVKPTDDIADILKRIETIKLKFEREIKNQKRLIRRIQMLENIKKYSIEYTISIIPELQTFNDNRNSTDISVEEDKEILLEDLNHYKNIARDKIEKSQELLDFINTHFEGYKIKYKTDGSIKSSVYW
jgi:hypothetical protein